jgi:hypothetical protein
VLVLALPLAFVTAVEERTGAVVVPASLFSKREVQILKDRIEWGIACNGRL